MSLPKKQIFLSPSRIDCYENCSQLYSARYLWKLPDTGNDGSRRGSTTHDILELLLKPRHRKHYTAAILHDSCREVPALWRTIRRFAKRYLVDDPENLDLINSFIMVALKDSFFGPPGVVETLGEMAFSFVVRKPNGIYYAIRGKIDKTFKIKDKNGFILDVTDMKTSKARFSGDKEIFNIQSLCYQIALRHLHPDIPRRRFHFAFLKFPKRVRQTQPSFLDEELNGFEWLLTDYQNAIEGFALENAMDNLAADDIERKWLCGREGFKKDGTPAFICGARNPMDYWVALDEDGEIAASAFEEKELTLKDGWRAEKRRYPGCGRFWNPETGQRRNFN